MYSRLAAFQSTFKQFLIRFLFKIAFILQFCCQVCFVQLSTYQNTKEAFTLPAVQYAYVTKKQHNVNMNEGSNETVQ
jgi:hypothetical protein